MFNFDKFEKNIAVITETGEELTYDTLNGLQKKWASYVSGRELVLMLCSENIETIVGYISCLINKIVVIMLDGKTDLDYIKHIIQTYRPNYVWGPLNNVVVSHKTQIYAYKNYKLVRYNVNKISIFSELAVLFSTSGSTGNPKLVRLSYDNIEQNTKSIISYLDIDKKQRAALSLPLSYVYGLSVLNTHLYVGASILLIRRKVFDIEYWDIFNRFTATSISGVPYTYKILKSFNFSKLNLPTLQYMTQAGGHLSDEVISYFLNYSEQNNKKFFVMYGQTEATARISYVPYEYLSKKKGSIGIPIRGGEMKIVSEDNSVLSESYKVGEIIYKGRNVSLGYADNQYDLCLGDLNCGILHTGDIGYFDNDNYFYIVGRKSRIKKVLGIRINLDDIEKELNKRFNINFACVSTDKYIYIASEELMNSNEIINFISKKINVNKSVFSISLTKFPRNKNGKIDYSKLYKIITLED